MLHGTYQSWSLLTQGLGTSRKIGLTKRTDGEMFLLEARSSYKPTLRLNNAYSAQGTFESTLRSTPYVLQW